MGFLATIPRSGPVGRIAIQACRNYDELFINNRPQKQGGMASGNSALYCFFPDPKCWTFDMFSMYKNNKRKTAHYRYTADFLTITCFCVSFDDINFVNVEIAFLFSKI